MQFTTSEIVDQLKELWELKTDTQLGEYLGVSRKTIWQVKQGKSTDVKSKIICKLLEHILKTKKNSNQ